MNSKEYWIKRINAEMAVKQARDIDIGKEYDKLFRQQYKELEKEIDDMYIKYLEKDGKEPTKRAVTMLKKKAQKQSVIDLAEQAEQYVKNHDWSPEANEFLRLYNLKIKSDQLDLYQYRMELNLIDLADKEHKLTKRYLDEAFRNELHLQQNILGAFVPEVKTLKRMADSIINVPYEGAEWSFRIWERQEKLRTLTHDLVTKAVMQGKNAAQLKTELKKAYAVTAYQAKRLAVTETARVHTEVQRQSYEENGIKEYQYLAEPTACPICAELHEKHFKVSEMQPGTNASPMHPNCHCSTAPYATDMRKALDEELDALRRALEKEEEAQAIIDKELEGKDSGYKLADRESTISKIMENANLSGEDMKAEFRTKLDNFTDSELNMYSKISKLHSNNIYNRRGSGAYYDISSNKVYMNITENTHEKALELKDKFAWQTKFHEEMHQLDNRLGAIKKWQEFKVSDDDIRDRVVTKPSIYQMARNSEFTQKVQEAMHKDILNNLNRVIENYNNQSDKPLKLLDSLDRIPTKAKQLFIEDLKASYPTEKDKVLIRTYTDFLGSSTNGKLNVYQHGFWGHSVSYDKEGGIETAAMETLANHFSNRLIKSEEQLKLLEELAPSTNKLFNEKYAEVLKYFENTVFFD